MPHAMTFAKEDCKVELQATFISQISILCGKDAVIPRPGGWRASIRNTDKFVPYDLHSQDLQYPLEMPESHEQTLRRSSKNASTKTWSRKSSIFSSSPIGGRY